MGVKVKFFRGCWWIFVNHRGQRKAKRIGPGKETAQRVARAIRERLARGDFNLEPGGELTNDDIDAQVGTLLRLPDDAWEPAAGGNGRRLVYAIRYRLRWVRTGLKRAGLITNPRHAVWTLVNHDLDLSQISIRAVETASHSGRIQRTG